MVNEEMLESFLRDVDHDFPLPLSKKQDLKLFTKKLLEKATLCSIIIDGEIHSLVAGYTDHVLDNMGYISIVATRNEARGKGYATKLIKEFIEISKEKKLSSIHLYAVECNNIAVNMYLKLGFRRWIIENEPRINDIHLIYNIKKEDVE